MKLIPVVFIIAALLVMVVFSQLTVHAQQKRIDRLTANNEQLLADFEKLKGAFREMESVNARNEKSATECQEMVRQYGLAYEQMRAANKINQNNAQECIVGLKKYQGIVAQYEDIMARAGYGK